MQWEESAETGEGCRGRGGVLRGGGCIERGGVQREGGGAEGGGGG